MNTLNVILKYYAEGELTHMQLVEYLDSIGATQQSIKYILNRASFMRAEHLSRIKKYDDDMKSTNRKVNEEDTQPPKPKDKE